MSSAPISEINTRVFSTAEKVAIASAGYIYERIMQCVEDKGVCHVVLPGGTTPVHSLEYLSRMDIPWDRVHWYPGDERCLPPGDADRNDSMLLKALFSDVDHDQQNFHAISAELGPVAGAEHYCELLKRVGHFDLVILGMGEDGHTASLFPGNPALEMMAPAVPVFDSPKPPSERVSISMNMLKQASERIVIATGEGKREAFIRLDEGERLPVAAICPDIWFVDEQAIGGISL